MSQAIVESRFEHSRVELVLGVNQVKVELELIEYLVESSSSIIISDSNFLRA